VDEAAHIIVAAELGNTAADANWLLPMVEAVQAIDSEVFILKYSVMPSHGDDGNHRHEKAFA
jgi:hypothetical protein